MHAVECEWLTSLFIWYIDYHVRLAKTVITRLQVVSIFSLFHLWAKSSLLSECLDLQILGNKWGVFYKSIWYQILLADLCFWQSLLYRMFNNKKRLASNKEINLVLDEPNISNLHCGQFLEQIKLTLFKNKLKNKTRFLLFIFIAIFMKFFLT